MELRFSCYHDSKLDYPYVARVKHVDVVEQSFPIHNFDYGFNKWSESSNISFYRLGREFRFTNEADRLMFVLSWS